MKYMASARQPKSFLKQINEILIEYKDRNILYDFCEDFENKDFYIRIPKDQLVDWEELQSLEIKLAEQNNNLIIGLEDFANNLKIMKKYDFSFYWIYPATTYAELQNLIINGVCEILLGEPLCFNLPQIKALCDKYNIELRMVANLCFDGYIPRVNGINGTYIRPEDVKAYDEYIDTIQFFTDDIKTEQTLIEIYKKGEWPGNLNLLLTNLLYDVDNRGFDEDFASARIRCKQKCMEPNYLNRNCQFCFSYFNLLNEIHLNKKELLEKTKDKNYIQATKNTMTLGELKIEQGLIDEETEKMLKEIFNQNKEESN